MPIPHNIIHTRIAPREYAVLFGRVAALQCAVLFTRCARSRGLIFGEVFTAYFLFFGSSPLQISELNGTGATLLASQTEHVPNAVRPYHKYYKNIKEIFQCAVLEKENSLNSVSKKAFYFCFFAFSDWPEHSLGEIQVIDVEYGRSGVIHNFIFGRQPLQGTPNNHPHKFLAIFPRFP